MNITEIHNIIHSTLEEDILKKMNRDTFFSLFELAKIDLLKLASKRKKNDYAPYHQFNFILKDLHQSEIIDITDACLHITTEMLTEKELTGCLNEENRYSLRISLARRNGINIKVSSLNAFMFKKKKVENKEEISPKT